jgi:3-oxoacyl-[acyl-carrier protein] reductase
VNLGLEGKVALIGGGSRGIGLAIAHAFAAERARVAIVGRTQENLDAAVGELGADAFAVRADLRVPEDAARAVDSAREHFGALDVAVANAGSGRGPAEDDPPAAAWADLMAENLGTAVNLCQAYAGAMTDGGALILIGSIVGIESLPAPLPYSAAKAALVRYNHDLARRLAARGVRVNMVVPGNVLFAGGSWQRRLDENREQTEEFIRAEVPMARFATPEEIADAVVFLASERSSFTTGACLVIDGGQLRA